MRKNLSEEKQLKAVIRDPYKNQFIENPSEAVQMAAVQRWGGRAIQSWYFEGRVGWVCTATSNISWWGGMGGTFFGVFALIPAFLSTPKPSVENLIKIPKRVRSLYEQAYIESWHEVMANPTLSDAILDQLVHIAHRVKLKGESMRKQLAKLSGPVRQSSPKDVNQQNQ